MVDVSESLAKPCTAFEGARQLSSGPLVDVVLAVKDAVDGGSLEPLLVFDDATGRLLDFDLRGSKIDVIARLSNRATQEKAADTPTPARAENEAAAGQRNKGRPKLGVIAREVTLLPRHWAWLATQRGGASATLRRLVEEARRAGGPGEKGRAAQEAAYRFMSAIGGDLPGFEEATRALFADDRARMERHMTGWPGDIRDHAMRLAWGGDGTKTTV
jgi:hypothetical protein